MSGDGAPYLGGPPKNFHIFFTNQHKKLQICHEMKGLYVLAKLLYSNSTISSYDLVSISIRGVGTNWNKKKLLEMVHFSHAAPMNYELELFNKAIIIYTLSIMPFAMT